MLAAPVGWNMTQVIQNALTMLRAGEWIPVTAARVLIGIFFCISGGTKLFVKAQFGVLEKTMVQIHVPFPHWTALFVAMVEFACGAGLALGLLTPFCAAMLTADMIVAIATTSAASRRAPENRPSVVTFRVREIDRELRRTKWYLGIFIIYRTNAFASE